jgi:NAD(P)-dependent dehydrogenase (short-subunit alcohol dehydrogenase family)
MGIAFVTGTSTGIGMATAVSLARAGHIVYAGMRNPQRSGELHDAVAREHLTIRIVAHDVDGDPSARGAIEQALVEQGRIDVLVNNAGVSGMGAVEETPLSDFRATMETNFFGALRCMQAVLPGMREQGGGCIVNVTSISGRMASAAHAPYSASKWAMEALSECLAQEVKRFGIRVAIVEPGVIATPIFGKAAPDLNDTRYPHKRRLKELFRASLEKPVSPFVVGDTIRDIVDSGTWTLRHPVGPDAAGFLRWRASLTDEQWVASGAMTDAEWVTHVRGTFGLNVSLSPRPR